MLILHQSNRLEHLAEALASLLNAMPLEDVFESETIVIQSQGMRRYINRYLAQKTGIAANIDFSLPARLMWQLMQQNLNNLSKLSPFATDVLHWRLMQLFEDAPFREQPNAAATYLHQYMVRPMEKQICHRSFLISWTTQSPACIIRISGQRPGKKILLLF